METVRYSLIGREDLRRGIGTFPVTLADGTTPSLNEIDAFFPGTDAATLASFPSASRAGRLWRRTDGGRGLYMATGSVWSPLNGGVVNVMDFGVKADGVTDDTTALQAALAIGGCIHLPTGTMKTTATLTISNNTHLYGNGHASATASIISYSGTGDAMQISNPVNSSTGAYITLRDFAIMSTTGSPVATKACLADTGSSFLCIERVRTNGNWAGIILDQTEVSSLDGCVIEAASTIGLWLVNGNAHNGSCSRYFTNQISVSNTQFNMSSTPNTFLLVDDGGADHEFKNNNFNGGGTWARLASQSNSKFTNNEFEGAADASPITFNAATSVNAQAVAAGTTCTFDSNIFTNSNTQKAIEIIGANTQNTIVCMANVWAASSNPRIVGGDNLAQLVMLGNYTSDGNFYSVFPPTMHDYQTGTWTPTGNVVTLTVTSATYVRIGRQVTVQFDVTWPATANGAAARIGGLPFAPTAAWAGAGCCFISSTTTVQQFYGDSSTYLSLYTSGVGLTSNATMSTLRVFGTYTYFR